MGLYIKVQQSYDTKEELVFRIYENLIQQLERDFEFRPLTKFKLHTGDFDGEIEYKQKNFIFEEFQKEYIRIQKNIKEKKDITQHFSISVEGTIKLNPYRDDVDESLIVDVLTTCTDLKRMYGNVWITFYDTNIKWENYFTIEGTQNDKNREKFYQLIKNITQPDFKIYSIFFARSNFVFDLLNEAFYIYFKEYKFFIEYCIEILGKRISVEDLDYEKLPISDDKRTLITEIQNDLKLYNESELVEIIDRKTNIFSDNFQRFVSDQYHNKVIYSTASSVEIKAKDMNSKIIRKAYTDFLGNFLTSLYSTLPRYDKFEKEVQKGFNTHEFKPEKKKRWDTF